MSERCACHVLRVHCAIVRYRSQAKHQTALNIRIRGLTLVRVRYGYRRIIVLLEHEAWTVIHKSVYRLYKQECLEVRPKTRQMKGVPQPMSLNPEASLQDNR